MRKRRFSQAAKVRPGMKNGLFLFSGRKKQKEFLVLVPFNAAACVPLAYVFKKKLRSDKSRYAFNGNQLVRQKRTASVRAKAEKNKRQGAWHEQARYLLSVPRDGQGLKKQHLKRQYEC